MLITMVLAVLSALSAAPGLAAQAGTIDLSAERWCADSGTACWGDPRDRSFFNGVRIVADLDLSLLFQGGGNRFQGAINTFPKVALETNLLGGWVALQVAVIAPGTIQLDDRSPAVAKLRADLAGERKVHFDYGLLAGLSFLDGSLSAGGGIFRYDRRDFVDLAASEAHFARDRFIYVSLQPISSIRANLKEKKRDEESTPTTQRVALPRLPFFHASRADGRLLAPRLGSGRGPSTLTW